MIIRFFKSRLFEFCVTVLSLGICGSIFTFVADDYGAFGYNLASGQFSNYPYIESHYLGLIGISKVLEALYIRLPDYNWLGISFIAFQLVALYLMLRAIKNIVFPNSQNMFLVRLIQFFFILFYIENIIFLSHTRYSLLLCGLALLNLAFTSNIKWRHIIANTAIFILGALIRPESSLGTLILVSAGFLIFRFDLLFLVKRFFLPLLFTAALFSAFLVDWFNTDIYVRKVEPEIEYNIMGRRVIDISSFKTAEDSVKYEAAMVGMWFDMNVITPEFLRSLLLSDINLSYERASESFFRTTLYYEHYGFLICSISVLMILCYFESYSRGMAYKIALFNFLAFIIIFLTNFYGRLIAERHFLNLQLISLLITSAYFFSAIDLTELWNKYKIIVSLSMVLVFFGASLAIANYAKNNDRIAIETDCFNSAMKDIESRYSGRLIVSTLSNVYLLNRNFSIKNNNYTNNTYVLFDVFTYSLLPKYIEYLNDLCDCKSDNPIVFFKWLSSQNALYIAEPDRYDLTRKYMNIVHNLDLTFVSLEYPKPECIKSTEMMDYEVRQVFVTYPEE